MRIHHHIAEKRGTRENLLAGAATESSHPEPPTRCRELTGKGTRLLNLNPTPRDIVLPARPQLLNLAKQCH